MAQSEWMAPLRGGRLRCSLAWLPLAAHDRVVAIGETIGATFPFTGEGIGKAMETAEIAAAVIDEALDRDDPAELRRLGRELHRRLKPRYEGYERAEAWMSRPWAADPICVARPVAPRRAVCGCRHSRRDGRSPRCLLVAGPGRHAASLSVARRADVLL